MHTQSIEYATVLSLFGVLGMYNFDWNMKKLFCCPALELFRCLPLWKTVLFVSSRAFLLSTPTFLLSTLYKNSEATWKKATKCNKVNICNQQLNFWLINWRLHNWFSRKPQLKALIPLWSNARWYLLVWLTLFAWLPPSKECWGNMCLMRCCHHF